MDGNSVLQKQIPLGCYTVSLDSVAKIFDGLQAIVREQAEVDLAKWQRHPDQTDEEFVQRKEQVTNDAYRVTITVNRDDGSRAYGDRREIFTIQAGEPHISSIYMTNNTAFAAMVKANPNHSFELFLDFSQPPLLDANNVVSSPTSNASSLSVQGQRAGWMAGIESVVRTNINKKHSMRRFLHLGFVYDLGLMLFGVPLSMYLCWLVSNRIHSTLGPVSQILVAAAYIYIFFCGLWAYRVLFGYTKWAFPVAELAEQTKRPKKHRKFWWGLVAAIVLKVFWDLFDPYLSVRGWMGW